MLNEKQRALFLKASQEWKCRYCDQTLKAEDATTTYSYWQGVLFFCHLDCKKSGEKEEKIACQTIDADCNDCFFFQRGAVISKLASQGLCQKFNKTTIAYPVFSSGHFCFEHRNKER